MITESTCYLDVEDQDYETIENDAGWSDKSQAVPDDVRRIWDSEAMAGDDDCAEGLLDSVDAAYADFLMSLELPDFDDDVIRTDTWGEDYRIEEALEGCAWDTDVPIKSNCGRGLENISDVYDLVESDNFNFGIWG